MRRYSPHSFLSYAPAHPYRTAMQAVWRLFLILSLLSVAHYSQGAAANDLDRLPTVTDIADASAVPFEYHEHMIFVHGSLDGHTDLTFIVDTGASVSVLNSDIGFTGAHLRNTPVMDLCGQTTAEMVQFDTLQIPGQSDIVTRQNVAFLRMDLSGLERALGAQIDGILGIPFLAEFVTEFDYASHVIRFYDGALFGLSRCEPDNRLSFLLDMEPLCPGKSTSCLVISGSVRGSSGRFLLDTGFTGAISIAAPTAQEAGLFDTNSTQSSIRSVGLTDSLSGCTVAEAGVLLGSIDLRSHPATVRSPGGGGLAAISLVGNQFLENYRMVLDYRRRKLWLEHPVD